MNGKGDCYRPVNRKKYDENYDRIFRQDQQKEQQNSVKQTDDTVKAPDKK